MTGGAAGTKLTTSPVVVVLSNRVVEHIGGVARPLVVAMRSE